jgi:sugar phosphate isomerase/epimerase
MLPASIFIGNQTTKHAPAATTFDFAVRNRFDAFEWFSDKARLGWSEDDFGPAVRAHYRQVAENLGIRFSIHAPIDADPLRPGGATALRKSIICAADLGAAVVNLHLFPEHGARPFAEALRPLLKLAGERNVRLSLENTPWVSPDDFNAVFGVLATIPEATDRIGMCLDMGHANLFPATRNDFLRYVDLLGDHVPIIHLHAHENWGDRDSHLPLFSGPSAQNDQGVRGLFDRLIRREFSGSVVLEQWPNPPELLVQARAGLRRLIAV